MVIVDRRQETSMSDDPYRVLLVGLGIPLSLWFVSGTVPGTLRQQFGIALVWFGFGVTLLLLSRDHAARHR